ncbi:amino acid transporter [Purpureocillium lavendulum]|uniref:Amino acid transporter n=1 Tax=Purpureocillium lavendulum TaxID=1247861 RepID=A0AB34FKL6_9HYPO|nr:amino acid transporter [Purpureocillium lavendulum]
MTLAKRHTKHQTNFAAMADDKQQQMKTQFDKLSEQEKTQTWTEWVKDFKPPLGFSEMSEEDQKKTYMEWARDKYNEQYENWMPWIEDHFLKWFTSDNKASYATKDTLDKSKVTGVEQVDKLQDGVNNLVAGQVGQGGLLQPLGDLASKEGVNRAERQGKDDKGNYAPTGL